MIYSSMVGKVNDCQGAPQLMRHNESVMSG